MNRDETIELFERCETVRAEAKKAALAEGKSEDEARDISHEAAKAAWNSKWAEPLLAEREAMEKDGHWKAKKDWKGDLEPQNDETRKWIVRAAADFTRIHFLVRTEEGTEVDAGEVKQMSWPDGLPIKTLSVEDSVINFSGFHFPGTVGFDNAIFSSTARFDSTTFSGTAWFDSVAFSGDARFDSAIFSSTAWFNDATFSGTAGFNSATFSSIAGFDSAAFSGTARFDSATFSGTAGFDSAVFSSTARFDSATLSGTASFNSATFSGTASFNSAAFSGDASFNSATFSNTVSFNRVAFSGTVFFDNALFQQQANFPLAKFAQYAGFEKAEFHGPADFSAVRGERAFTLEDAHFEHVPDFIQAHFEEAPRLDNVNVEGKRLEPPADDDPQNLPNWLLKQHRVLQRQLYLYRRVTMADRNIPARWRALKRLAIQVHDQDREHEFFAREIRSERYLNDWPLPLCRPRFSLPSLKWLNKIPFIFWYLRGWFSAVRFWAGCAYGFFSNYGRSVIQPAFWWGIGLIFAAMLYFAEHRDALQQQAFARPQAGPDRQLPKKEFLSSWLRSDNSPCYATTTQIANEHYPRRQDDKDKSAMPQIQVIGLSERLRTQTDGVHEAFQLALRDGFLIFYGDADTAYRTYGCLYGVELYGGGTPVAIVPPHVALWSAIHKLYSAVMIFLFGLALRNMLKMK